jgi:iron complex transport system substrate-binding protein
MKKLFAIIVIALLTFGALAGCAQKNDQANKENKVSIDKKVDERAFPVTIKDGLGKNITIKQKPEKIVSLIPSNTEIAFALGLDKEIIGVTDFDNYPKEALKKEKIGGQEFNVEKIVALKPDIVLAHASTATFSKDALKQISDAGITVLIVNNAQNFNEVYESISMIGKATGEKAKADKMIKEMKDQLAAIQRKAKGIKEKKKVLVEVQPAPEIYTTGKKTFIDEMLQAINAKNIADDQEGWIKIDQEAVLERNPDVIVTTYGFYVKNPIEQVLSRKGWESVNAIKNKQVFDVNSDRVTRSGPRIIEGVEDIAKAVYPEIFK